MNNQQDNSIRQQDTFRIIGIDDRKTQKNPAIVRLSYTYQDNRTGWGTGFLVNATTIITASHNISPHPFKLYNNQAKIIGRKKLGDPSSKTTGPQQKDLGLIILEHPGIYLNSYISLEVGQQEEDCLVIGYDMVTQDLRGAQGPATKSNGLYEYMMDTGVGQSGGPLLSSGTQNAIGVHIFGIEHQINYAAPITAEFINWVRNNSPA